MLRGSFYQAVSIDLELLLLVGLGFSLPVIVIIRMAPNKSVIKVRVDKRTAPAREIGCLENMDSKVEPEVELKLDGRGLAQVRFPCLGMQTNQTRRVSASIFKLTVQPKLI